MRSLQFHFFIPLTLDLVRPATAVVEVLQYVCAAYTCITIYSRVYTRKRQPIPVLSYNILCVRDEMDFFLLFISTEFNLVHSVKRVQQPNTLWIMGYIFGIEIAEYTFERSPNCLIKKNYKLFKQQQIICLSFVLLAVRYELRCAPYHGPDPNPMN